MIKYTLILLIFTAILILPLRFAVNYSTFFREGVINGLQACKKDADCLWVPTGCCDCSLGGGEMLINRDKELIYKILVKPLCLETHLCNGEDACHTEEVYCDRTCKHGDPEYTKPLLLR